MTREPRMRRYATVGSESCVVLADGVFVLLCRGSCSVGNMMFVWSCHQHVVVTVSSPVFVGHGISVECVTVLPSCINVLTVLVSRGAHEHEHDTMTLLMA